MIRVKVENFDSVIRRIGNGLENYKEELNAGYGEAVQKVGKEVQAAAVGYLNKPNWELSKAIHAGKLKFYEERKIHFLSVEPAGSYAHVKNTPGDYGYYQEHGYIVKLDKVRRPKQARVITKTRKKKKTIAYQKQVGKEFFKKASQNAKESLQKEIEAVNERIRLKLKD